MKFAIVLKPRKQLSFSYISFINVSNSLVQLITFLKNWILLNTCRFRYIHRRSLESTTVLRVYACYRPCVSKSVGWFLPSLLNSSLNSSLQLIGFNRFSIPYEALAWFLNRWKIRACTNTSSSHCVRCTQSCIIIVLMKFQNVSNI